MDQFAELEVGNSMEYEIEELWDNKIYAQKSENNFSAGLYYLVLWKTYSMEKNTSEPLSAIEQL